LALFNGLEWLTLKKRIATGLIGGAVFLSLLFYGGIGYSVLLFFVATLGFVEWLKMNGIRLTTPHGIIGLLFTIYYFLPIEAAGLSATDVLFLEVIMLLSISVFSKNKVSIHDVAYIFVGSVYIGISLHYMLETRFLENGILLTLTVLIGTWATDTAAYFVGKAVGKNKLWPAISPNKTIEGSLGGVVVAIISLAMLSLFTELAMGYAIVLALVISISAQLGDLIESAVKRTLEVKDSGRILPGHGGVLDRFDSLLFVFPVLHLLSLL
jgi:phosphatidate cytidylyltransferase